MTPKRIVAWVSAAVLTASLSLSAMAQTTTDAIENEQLGIGQSSSDEKQPPKLTDEQKADLNRRFERMEQSWRALSDGQREQIYKMQDKAIDANIKVIEKYIEYGVILPETGKELIEMLKQEKIDIRNDNRIPILSLWPRKKQKSHS